MLGKYTGTQIGLTFAALVTFATYPGIGLGSGLAVRQQFSDGSLRPDHIIRFTNNDVEEVRLIGVNSSSIFYVGQGETVVTLSSFQHHISSLQKVSSSAGEP